MGFWGRIESGNFSFLPEIGGTWKVFVEREKWESVGVRSAPKLQVGGDERDPPLLENSIQSLKKLLPVGCSYINSQILLIW